MVEDVRVFINGTQYGTTTDKKGRFELELAPNWTPIAGGTVELLFMGNPFDFEEQTVSVNVRDTPLPGPLVVRMKSIEHRGQIVGLIEWPVPPVEPPRK